MNDRIKEAVKLRETVTIELSHGILISNYGGNCPVQIEGTIDGSEFYFRARGEHWSIGIGGDPVSSPEWDFEEEYGTTQFEAGWMPIATAFSCVERATEMYRAMTGSRAINACDAFIKANP